MALTESKHQHNWYQVVAGYDQYEPSYKKFKTLWRCECGVYKWGTEVLTPISKNNIHDAIDTQGR